MTGLTGTERFRKIAMVALAISPALLPLYLVVAYGVDIPFWDQWSADIAGMFVKMHERSYSLRDLMELHNEHRIVIPRIIYLLLGLMTHWNVRAEMLAAWLTIVATSIVVLHLLRATAGQNHAPERQAQARLDSRVLWLWLLCNILIFTPAQWENLLWGMGLANVLPVMFVIMSLAAANSALSSRKRLAAVILLNTAASFSQGGGVLAWPLTAALLAWSSSRAELKSKLPTLAIFVAALLANLALYLIGYSRPDHGGANPYTLRPSLLIPYFSTYMASAFSLTMRYHAMHVTAVLTWFMILLLAIAQAYHVQVMRRGDARLSRGMLVWLAISWFAVLSGVMASVSRGGFGTEQALTSRYVSFSVYLPVGLIPLIAMMSNDLARRRGAWVVNADPPRLSLPGRLAVQVPAVLAFAVVLWVFMSLPSTFDELPKAMAVRRQGKLAVLLSKVAPDVRMIERAAMKPAADVLTYAPKLSAMDYLRPPLITTAIATELPAGREMPFQGKADSVWRTTSDTITFSGWAVFSGYLRRRGAVFITCNDMSGRPVILAVAEMGLNRADRSGQALRASGSASGWVATVPVSRLPSAPARLSIRGWVMDVETGLVAAMDGVLTVDRMQ